MSKKLETYQLKLIRGAILAAMLELYPKPTLGATVRHVVQDLGISDDDLYKELAYFKIRGWISSRPTRLLGRVETIYELTAAGYDLAKGIDPNEPLLELE